jgi:hypothetical protein
VPVKWVIAARWPVTTRLVTTHPLEEETTRRHKGTVQEVPVGHGSKGPDRLRASRGDRPRAPRRREMWTPPGNRVTALRRIAQHRGLAATRARIFGGSPTWPRTKRWKLLRPWRCRGAWASHRQQTRPGFPDGARADEVPSGRKQPLRRIGPSRPTQPPRRSMRSGPPTVRRSGLGRLSYRHCRQRQEQRVLQSGRSPRCIRGRNLGALRSKSYCRPPYGGPAAAEGV